MPHPTILPHTDGWSYIWIDRPEKERKCMDWGGRAATARESNKEHRASFFLANDSTCLLCGGDNFGFLPRKFLNPDTIMSGSNHIPESEERPASLHYDIHTALRYNKAGGPRHSLVSPPPAREEKRERGDATNPTGLVSDHHKSDRSAFPKIGGPIFGRRRRKFWKTLTSV